MKTSGFFAFTAFALGVTFAGRASAQERREAPRFTAGEYTFVPEIDLRLRGEWRKDKVDYQLPTIPRSDVFALLTRARVGLGVERDYLRVKVTLQDARYVGNETATIRVPTPFGPYEAYAEATTSTPRPSFVRIGRQPVEWGEGRLLGVADFSPTGRSLDAIRARAVLGNFELEGLGALVTTPDFDTNQSGTQLVAARVAYTFVPQLTVEAFGFARYADERPPLLYPGQTSEDPATYDIFAHTRARSDLYTASLRLSGRDDAWTYGVEGSIQKGNANRNGTWVPISAFAFAGHVDRRFLGIRGRPTLRVLGGYASGGERGGELRHFDPMLPDTQRWHGRFDLFGFSNLADVGGQLEISPTDWITADVGYRYAHLANAKGEWIGAYLTTLGTPRDDGSGALGNEVSFGLSVEPTPGLTLTSSYAVLALGESGRAAFASRLRFSGGDIPDSAAPDLTHYGYLGARVRFP